VAPQFGVDHDFPEPILNVAEPFLPFGVTMIRHISPKLTQDLDDWQVLLALRQLGYDGLITLDYNMLELPKEMAVLHQTELTLVAIEAAGDSPLRAMGQLMLHATHVARNFDPDRPQIFRFPKPRPNPPIRAWDRLGEIATATRQATQELYDAERLTLDELAEPVI